MIWIGPQVNGDRRTGVRVKIGPVSAMIESDLSRRDSSREAVGAGAASDGTGDKAEEAPTSPSAGAGAIKPRLRRHR